MYACIYEDGCWLPEWFNGMRSSCSVLGYCSGDCGDEEEKKAFAVLSGAFGESLCWEEFNFI